MTRAGSRAPPAGAGWALYLIVSDIEARRGFVARGVDVSDVFDEATGVARILHTATDDRVSGPAPDRGTDGSFATFSDPDGNGWLLQEVSMPMPGRINLGATKFATANDSRTRFAARQQRTKRTRTRTRE